MFPDSTICIFEAVQGLIEERLARTKRRALIHGAMQGQRARRQFRRSIAHSLRSGLSAQELASELRSILRTQARN